MTSASRSSSCSSISSVLSVSSVRSVSSVELDSSSDDEYENSNTIPERPRILRDRDNQFDIYDEQNFKIRFRISKHAVLVVFDLIKENIQPLTHRNQSISTMNQLLITLSFYAHGTFPMDVAHNFNINTQTIFKIIHKVSHYLALLREKYVHMPKTVQERNEMCADFFRISGFPNVIGVIDCTHIKIQSPGGDNAEVFRNSKGWFSLKIQAVCDAKLRITDIVARWPGSVHNDHIFNCSYIMARFENKEFEHTYLLGNNSYICCSYLLTPLVNPVTEPEKRYNEAHVKTCSVIENTFDVLKRRFPCLSLGLRLSVKEIMPMIVAMCVLHNIAININDTDYENENLEQNHLINNNGRVTNNAIRNAVINTIFRC